MNPHGISPDPTKQSAFESLAAQYASGYGQLKVRRWSEAELPQLLESALLVLPEYSDKLDRIVQSAVNIWDKRQKQPNKHTTDITAAAARDLDPLLHTALRGLSREMGGLVEPLKQWIHKLSAVLEEAKLTDLQRMELQLRLTELELKFQTAIEVTGLLGLR